MAGRALGMCGDYFFFFSARFQRENVKLFGNISPRGAFTEQSCIQLSSARTSAASSIVEHMPLSV